MFKKFKAFDDIPKEKQKDALKLEDGSYVLDDSADIEALKASNTAIRGERDTFERDWKTEKTRADDTQRTLDAKVASLGDVDKNTTAMLAQWKLDTAKAVADAVKDKDTLIDKLTVRVTKYDLHDKLGARFIDKAVNGREERKDKAIQQALADGWVLEGEEAVRKDAQGRVMTQSIDDYFIKDLKVSLPEFFKGTLAAGSGAAGDQQPAAPGAEGAPAGGKKPTQMTADERRTFIEQNGQPAYRQLLDTELQQSMKPAAPAAAGGAPAASGTPAVGV